MSGLSITVPFHDDETLTSLCSRTAAANGISTAREFCTHMGFRFQHIIDGRTPAIDEFAYITSSDAEYLRSRALVKDGARFRIGMEDISKFDLARSRARFCPKCFEDDLNRGSGPEHSRGYGRLAWIFSCIRTCQKHNQFLCEATRARTAVMNDFVNMVEEAWADACPLSADPAPRSMFERYLEDRLAKRERSETWLNSLPLQVVLRVPEIIGGMIRHGHEFKYGALSVRQSVEAAEEGFRVMAQGEDSFVDFLNVMQKKALAGTGDLGGSLLYGRLYDILAHATKDPNYDPIRKIMRDTAIDNTPIGPGNALFGPVDRRKLHSVTSATNISGMHFLRLKKLLRAKGLIGAVEFDLSPHRIMIDAQVMEDFLAIVTTGLAVNECYDLLGIPRQQWQPLLRVTGLEPFIPANEETKVWPIFGRKSVQAVLDKMLSMETIPYDGSEDLQDIKTVRKRTLCKFEEIYGLLLSGKLKKVAVDVRDRGLASLRVSLEEVRDLVQLDNHGGMSLRQAERALGTAYGVLQRLIDDGHIRSRRAINPVNRCPQTVIDPSDVAEFNCTFVGLNSLVMQHRRAHATIRNILGDAGVTPAFPPDELGCTFYRRDEVEGKLTPKGHAN
ncbi:TniQ family protein [Rhizobium leguminosarum]|uniref:TniQ family protein n=1 Tax=Rhizobium leguminosarum TaxID=384 RepID=UPI00103DDB22|nr:TniQ family protein [Rhizobium leguminosarum]TBZ57139.1 hypothetical protein E0H48_16905 [Rhizobium leguminosarum bv. viciae]